MASGIVAIMRVCARGTMQFAVTPYLPRSRETTFVKPPMPAFAAP